MFFLIAQGHRVSHARSRPEYAQFRGVIVKQQSVSQLGHTQMVRGLRTSSYRLDTGSDYTGIEQNNVVESVRLKSVNFVSIRASGSEKGLISL